MTAKEALSPARKDHKDRPVVLACLLILAALPFILNLKP